MTNPSKDKLQIGSHSLLRRVLSCSFMNKKICSSDWKQSTLCCAPPTAALCSLLYRSTLSLSSIEYIHSSRERGQHTLSFLLLWRQPLHIRIQSGIFKSTHWNRALVKRDKKGKLKSWLVAFFTLKYENLILWAGISGWWDDDAINNSR